MGATASYSSRIRHSRPSHRSHDHSAAEHILVYFYGAPWPSPTGHRSGRTMPVGSGIRGCPHWGNARSIVPCDLQPCLVHEFSRVVRGGMLGRCTIQLGWPPSLRCMHAMMDRRRRNTKHAHSQLASLRHIGCGASSASALGAIAKQ